MAAIGAVTVCPEDELADVNELFSKDVLLTRGVNTDPLRLAARDMAARYEKQ